MKPILILPILAACAASLLAEESTTTANVVADTRLALPPRGLRILPEHVRLSDDNPRQQLLVTGTVDGRDVDLTRSVVFESADPSIATVDAGGVVRPISKGRTTITSRRQGVESRVDVEVNQFDGARPLDFERDVQPVLTRMGCNAGPCHGKQRGQNGFQLSLLGFDSDFDHAALVKEARGRRVFFAVPEESLLLRKPIGADPHGGGVRLDPGGDEYRTLLRWIAAGAPRRQPDAPALEQVTVHPQELVLADAEQQQLIVTATYDDGSQRDVTALTTFQSNEDPIAAVDERGLITVGQVTGEVAVMARYLGHFSVARVTVPLGGESGAETANLPRGNFIDEHVAGTLNRLSLRASDPAPDEKFLRRAYIDVIGRIPTAEESREFLEDSSPEKRANLVDRLLERPEYAEHWANKWADLLRPNPYRVGIKATLNYDHWIRESFRRNKSYDQFVKELITGQGSTFRQGNVTLFRDRRTPDELTTIVSQLFLGVRLECAKCHHHPFEVWGQDDFYSFAAYFARLSRKGRGVSPPISGSEETVYAGTSGSVKHPLTDEPMAPRPLFGEASSTDGDEDPRIALADWIASPDNPYFAQTMANRVWADLMGRGLVEPVDDLRATNPPTNPELLTALGEHFRDSGFDVKQLIRAIATSNTYGLSSLPNERNLVDTRNFSRHYRQRLRAEVLLDSVCQITGVPEQFDAMPPGSSAKEVWTHRVGSLFLDAFGRPDPNQDPPCERTPDSTVVQTLHLMNSPRLHAKVTSDSGRAAKLADSERTPSEIVNELYLWAYNRPPDKEELQIATELYDNEADRRQTTEDLLWALLNTAEFVYKD